MPPKKIKPEKPKTVPVEWDLSPNDHVYVSAPWSRREGEPYLVARVMELLAAAPVPAHSTSRSPVEPRVRVAYYLRPRDVSNRYIADFHLVIATMHADIVPLSYIRGRCTVMHKEHIADVEVYKLKDDSFYFHQLYDRYLHRYFDVVPTENVKNAPAHIVEYLVGHFEFILCEAGMSAELCDAQRGCSICYKWASNAESVDCAICKNVFHLSCLDPPLSQKPKIGYSWACAPCSQQHDEEVENYMETGIAPLKKVMGRAKPKNKVGRGLTNKDKGKGKEVITTGDVMRTTNGWPFRYFGMHTETNTVMDAHDSLYPRASTRLGNGKYQCVVPSWDPTAVPGASTPSDTTSTSSQTGKRPRGSTTPVKVEPKGKGKLGKKVVIPERGDDAALKVTYRPSESMTEEQLDEFIASVKRLPSYESAGVDLIDRALSLLETSTPSAALFKSKKIKQTELGHAMWTDFEIEDFGEAALHHGNDIEAISDEMRSKSIADIVKRYYIFLGHDMQEDVPQQLEEKVAAASAAEHKDDFLDSSDGEGSLCDPPTSTLAGKNRHCAICEIKTAEIWFRCPDSLGTAVGKQAHIMCEPCSYRWRHYAIQYPPVVEEPKPPPKVPGRKPKVTKPPKSVTSEEEEEVASSDFEEEREESVEPIPKATRRFFARSTPPPPEPASPEPDDTVAFNPKASGLVTIRPCLLCKRIEPKATLHRCKSCTMSAHTACYGIVPLEDDESEDEEDLRDWLCELCDLESQDLLFHPNPHCVLCPEPESPKPNAAITALDILKPTEVNNFIHLICAIWHPDVKFSKPILFSEIEGAALANFHGLDNTCSICNLQNVGASVKCAGCPAHFHISCAWAAGYRFGFEMHPMRKKHAKEIVEIKFKNVSGNITSGIWCNDHLNSQKILHDVGQKDSATPLTAMQVFVRNVKAGASDTYPLLRQAKRLDKVIAPVLAPPPQEIEEGVTPGTSVRGGSVETTATQPGTPELSAIPGKKPRKNAAKPKPTPVPRVFKVPRPPKKGKPGATVVQPLVVEPVSTNSPLFMQRPAFVPSPALVETEAGPSESAVKEEEATIDAVTPPAPVVLVPVLQAAVGVETTVPRPAGALVSAPVAFESIVTAPTIPLAYEETVRVQEDSARAEYDRVCAAVDRIPFVASSPLPFVAAPSPIVGVPVFPSVFAPGVVYDNVGPPARPAPVKATSKPRGGPSGIPAPTARPSPTGQAGMMLPSVPKVTLPPFQRFVAAEDGDYVPPANPTPKGPSNAERREDKLVGCSNCGTTVPGTYYRRDSANNCICNACGLYYLAHKTHRPASLVAKAIGSNRMAKRKATTSDSETPTAGDKGKKKKKRPVKARVSQGHIEETSQASDTASTSTTTLDSPATTNGAHSDAPPAAMSPGDLDMDFVARDPLEGV